MKLVLRIFTSNGIPTLVIRTQHKIDFMKSILPLFSIFSLPISEMRV
jgi:hypothetical protein